MKLKNLKYLILLIIPIILLLPKTLEYLSVPKIENIEKTEQQIIISDKNNIIINDQEKPIIEINEPKIFNTSFLFFGDIMTGRNVELLSKDNNDYPFLNIKELLNKKHDFTVANMEGPVDKNHVRTLTGSVSFSLPKYTIDILKQNNFNLLQLSNNHMQDRGNSGLINTQELLKNNNIDFFGDYYNKDEFSSFEKEINNQKFIFIGFNMINTDCEKNIENCIDNINSKIKKNLEGKNDYFSILFIHWGNEYKLKSNSIQQAVAHNAIDCGIDLIIGGHPHVTQEIEKYNGKIIFYSLGNFVFDQYFSKDTQQSLAIEFNLSSNDSINDHVLEFNIFPLQSIKSQPEIMGTENESIFLNTLIKNSTAELKDEILNKKIMVEIKN